MPRKPTKVNESSILLLKQFVQKKAGLSCTTFAEIQQLQYKIKKSVHESLSIQTLNRFFGLIKNDFKPSVATLDILARYVHFNSFSEFELLQVAARSEDEEHNSTLSLVTSLFSMLEYNGKIEKGVLRIVRNIHVMLQKDLSLAKEIYPFMASHEFGRKYFYEQFVHMDALNKHYGEGLNYFLIHCKERESCFFAYTLLCLRHFLSGQQQPFQHYLEKVQAYALDEIKTFSPALIGRYYATLLLNNDSIENYSRIVEEAMDVLTAATSATTENETYPAELAIAEVLIIKEQFELAATVLSNRKYGKIEHDSTFENWQTQYELLQLYAGFAAGQINLQKASALLLELQSRTVSFFVRDYYSILINNLYKEVLPKSFGKHSDRQIEQLISKTGFLFFSKKEDIELDKKVG